MDHLFQSHAIEKTPRAARCMKRERILHFCGEEIRIPRPARAAGRRKTGQTKGHNHLKAGITMHFLTDAQALEAEMRAFFEDLHQYPEPSHQEVRTNARVREALAPHGIELLTPADNITIAVVHGAHPGKTVGLRFDTDALQLEELTDLPYRSLNPGLMHGCGHDAHTTVGVYTARLLQAHRDALCGTYKIIFQPAEEGEHGAQEVISTGLVQDVDAFYGLHVWSLYPTGTLHASSGSICAEPDMFKITLHGKGGHGATPHLCTDAVAAGAAVVQSLQHIVSRFVSPMQSVVVTVGSFHAGTRCNIIAQEAVLEGTLRAFDEDVHAQLLTLFNRIVNDVSHAHGCTADIEINEVTGVVINDERLTRLANEAAAELVSPEAIMPQIPNMLGDDFAEYRRIAPSCYVQVGMGCPGHDFAHHHGQFCVDERVLPLATAWMAGCAVRAAQP